MAAIIENEKGMIWIGERIRTKGCWQFPQGGVDPGEGKKEACYREVREETGILKKDLEVLEKRKGYRYEFSGGRTKWGVYRGQEQTYFVMRYSGNESKINIKTPKPEFRDWKWIRPEDFDLNWLPSFKRKVYAQVWRDFFGIELIPSKKNK